MIFSAILQVILVSLSKGIQYAYAFLYHLARNPPFTNVHTTCSLLSTSM
jgi:hypothetical protein